MSIWSPVTSASLSLLTTIDPRSVCFRLTERHTVNLVHYLEKKSMNGRVCVATCGFRQPLEMKSDYTTKQPDTFTASEIGVTCSFCVSALVGKHQAAIIILQSQNFDAYSLPKKSTSTINLKDMLA